MWVHHLPGWDTVIHLSHVAGAQGYVHLEVLTLCRVQIGALRSTQPQSLSPLIVGFFSNLHFSFVISLVPRKEPQDLTSLTETKTSANLSWKEIPSADQRGFLTHYTLCILKVPSQDEVKGPRSLCSFLHNHFVELNERKKKDIVYSDWIICQMFSQWDNWTSLSLSTWMQLYVFPHLNFIRVP